MDSEERFSKTSFSLSPVFHMPCKVPLRDVCRGMGTRSLSQASLTGHLQRPQGALGTVSSSSTPKMKFKRNNNLGIITQDINYFP